MTGLNLILSPLDTNIKVDTLELMITAFIRIEEEI